MSPVLVLTMGPRLILTPTVFIGYDHVAFELVLNLLFVFLAAVQAAFKGTLLVDGIPVFGCLLRWVAAFGLDLEDTTVYVLVRTGF